jgi:hypothetical protein
MKLFLWDIKEGVILRKYFVNIKVNKYNINFSKVTLKAIFKLANGLYFGFLFGHFDFKRQTLQNYTRNLVIINV